MSWYLLRQQTVVSIVNVLKIYMEDVEQGVSFKWLQSWEVLEKVFSTSFDK